MSARPAVVGASVAAAAAATCALALYRYQCQPCTKLEDERQRRRKRKMDRPTMERLVSEAVKEGEEGWAEGGIPIGAVIADEEGNIVARGHNLRVQNGDPTSHGETQCIRNAGR